MGFHVIGFYRVLNPERFQEQDSISGILGSAGFCLEFRIWGRSFCLSLVKAPIQHHKAKSQGRTLKAQQKVG